MLCFDQLMYHNVICAIAAYVHLKIDKPVDYIVTV